jgi:hypothetical protein
VWWEEGETEKMVALVSRRNLPREEGATKRLTSQLQHSTASAWLTILKCLWPAAKEIDGGVAGSNTNTKHCLTSATRTMRLEK